MWRMLGTIVLFGTTVLTPTQPGTSYITPNGTVIQDTGPTINTPDGIIVKVPSNDDFQKTLDQVNKNFDELNKDTNQ